MDYSKRQLYIRRLAVLVVGLVVFVLAITWVIGFLTHGTLDVSTNSSNLITVTKVDNKNKDVYSKSAHGHLSLKTKTGYYVINVSGNSSGVATTAKVLALKTVKVNLNPSGTSEVGLVANQAASSLTADSTHLIYIDSASHDIDEIDGDNVPDEIADSGNEVVGLQSVQWINPQYGVGQNSINQFFIIKDEELSVLKTPVTPNPKSTTFSSYDLSPTKDIYVADGKTIYKGDSSGKFANIYTSYTNAPTLVAAAGKVAVIDNPQDASSPKGAATLKYLTVVDNAGKIIKQKMAVNTAAWSKTGKYLAVSVATSKAGEVLDSSLKRVAYIPQDNFLKPVWIDDNTLLYATTDQLWSYSLKSQTANLIANMPLGARISELDLSSEGDYAYLQTDNSSNISSIVRIGLKNQIIPSAVSQLQNVLPLSLDQCYLYMVNLTAPTVLVNPAAIVQPESLCVDMARNELQQLGINLSGVSVQIAPEESVDDEPQF